MLYACQAVKNRGSSPSVVSLDQQARRREIMHLIAVERFVGFRQHHQDLTRWDYPGHPTSGLTQKRFTPDDAAKLLRPCAPQ
jgi:hypothetical protein